MPADSFVQRLEFYNKFDDKVDKKRFRRHIVNKLLRGCFPIESSKNHFAFAIIRRTKKTVSFDGFLKLLKHPWRISAK